MKRKLTMILTCAVFFVVLCVLFCVSASAETYSGNCGSLEWLCDEETGLITSYQYNDSLRWTLDTDTGVLSITGTGTMGNGGTYYIRSSWAGDRTIDAYASWYRYRSSIRTVQIEDGVTSIGAHMFEDCENLNSITIPDSVRSIEDFAFFGCTGLSSMTIPDSISSIGASAFEGCWRLKELTIGNGVETIGEEAFRGCAAMQRFTMGDCSASVASSAFLGCSSLEHISLGDGVIFTGTNPFAETKYYSTESNWENGVLYIGSYLLKVKSEVTGILTIKAGTRSIVDSAVRDCVGLTDVIFPDGLRYIGLRSFSGCTGLTNITLPDGVTTIDKSAFYECTGLTSITVPDSVISIGRSAFYACSNLTSMTLPFVGEKRDEPSYGYLGYVFGAGSRDNHSAYVPASLKEVVITDTTGIDSYAFNGCKNLTNITIPDCVTSIGDFAFNNCTSLIQVHISDLSAWCKIRFNRYDSNPLYYAHNLYLNGTLVTDLVIPDSVTFIHDRAFYGCTSLESITIPDSITSIGSCAFYDCTGITSITIPDSVTSIDSSVFYNTGYYNDPDNWENDVLYFGKHLLEAKSTVSGSYSIKEGTLTIAGYAFNNCVSLTSIAIPDSVISIGSWAFSGCTGLTRITIPQVGVDRFRVSDLNSGTSYSVILSDSVTSIGDSAFSGCTGLIGITIPASVTSIGNSAFYRCTNLRDITIPDSVTSIGDSAFYNCTCLTSITIPDSVTSFGNQAFYGCNKLSYITILGGMTSIGNSAFSGCTGLIGITIPDSVTSIGDNAFYGCNKLSYITIWGGVSSIGSKAFYNCTSLKNVYNFSDLDITVGSTGNGYIAYYADSVGGAQEYCEAFGHTFVEDSDGKVCELCGTRAFLSGVCGEEGGNIQWTLNTATGVLELTGTGNMADYIQSVSTPWSADAFRVKTVLIGEGINRIGKYAFADCRNLTDVTIPASVMSIGESAFDGCTALNKVNVSDIAAWCQMDFAGLTSNPVYYAHRLYLNGELLTEVTIPEGVTSISLGAFYGCADLAKVILPDSVSRICSYAFDGCTGLTEIVIPDGVTKIESFVFFACISLRTVTFPAELTTIGYAAFYQCSALTALALPESLTTIETDAFYGCTKLKTVTNHSALPITAGSSDYGCVAKYADTVYSFKDGFTTVGGDLYYYQNGQVFKGWIVENGVTYYAQPDTGIVCNETQYINGLLFFWNDTTGLELANGFLKTANGTLCFENGTQVIGWRHADGTGPSVDGNGIFEQYSTSPNNLYYFLSTTGYMVTDSTYTLGGYTREFNDDHTVKPLSGLQNRYGELYYYVDGVMQTGWQTVGGNTYYFRASDAVYGRAATKWMYIGDKLYYFYASTSATPYALKTSGTIGGITYRYAEDGHILYNGFVNCDYANAANNNTAANIQKKNGTARYYVNGVMQTGWQQIGGKWYYFYAMGSANGSGYMCTESRTIGGVWYEFDASGVCTSK